jgi:hypothetical protein
MGNKRICNGHTIEARADLSFVEKETSIHNDP